MKRRIVLSFFYFVTMTNGVLGIQKFNTELACERVKVTIMANVQLGDFDQIYPKLSSICWDSRVVVNGN